MNQASNMRAGPMTIRRKIKEDAYLCGICIPDIYVMIMRTCDE